MPSEAATPAAANPCAEGGGEVTPIGLRLRISDLVDLKAWVCSTAAQLRVFVLDSAGRQQRVLDQQVGSQVALTLPPLNQGHYVLLWSFSLASAAWQTRVEVHVQGAVRFRHRKSNVSRDPATRGFLNLEIVP